MTQYKLRQAIKEDHDFLREMLYEAIYVPEGKARPSKDIIDRPEIAKYLSGWGRAGDIAFIAIDEDENPVGAVWTRLFDETNQTYGYINANTPVLSGMAVLPDDRGKGIGTLLLSEMINEVKKQGYSSMSLSVDPDNDARRLYEKYGFEKVGINGTSWDMVATLRENE
ncbi:GNAT family N-acetyltransferase [Halobacillus mangrovi]|uniref:GNAT family N-acetyltransferase n=1 Tax=Halobacillus mangrovi TaxID=402384 RepID=UPI001E44CF34|nr:GNAT family N-acetyltransferase [Halobacillus mangrovi]